jgi:hypothetical protein
VVELPFQRIVVADFEFHAPAGERPLPLCLVTLELFTGEIRRFWQNDLAAMSEAPYPTDDTTLWLAFYASAEWTCFLALHWRLPNHCTDLFAEFRALTNGLDLPQGAGLVGACGRFGIPMAEAAQKDVFRNLAIRGGPFTPDERKALVGYCGDDVLATGRLAVRMLPEIMGKPQGLDRALFHGDYTKAAACMEDRGIPVDTRMLARLRESWDGIKLDLIAEIDAEYGIYEGSTFKLARFEAWLAASGIGWPRLDSGQLDLTDDTFRQMAKACPAVSPLRELRHTLSQLRLNELAVGSDGRNRTMLSIMRSKTGRNQPSNSKFLFGAPAWLRGLIMPEPGKAVAYLDWKSQEVVIAAALVMQPCSRTRCRTLISASPSGPALCPQMPPGRPTAASVMRSSPWCSAFSTACRPRAWPAGSASPNGKPGGFWTCTARSTRSSGRGGIGP